eukprot:Rmarinus@m.14080
MVNCEGWLFKRGGGKVQVDGSQTRLSSWKRRYAVIEGTTLFYYAGESKNDLKGSLDLLNTSVTKLPPDGRRKFRFAVTSETRTLECCASTHEEMVHWIQAISEITRSIEQLRCAGCNTELEGTSQKQICHTCFVLLDDLHERDEGKTPKNPAVGRPESNIFRLYVPTYTSEQRMFLWHSVAPKLQRDCENRGLSFSLMELPWTPNSSSSASERITNAVAHLRCIDICDAALIFLGPGGNFDEADWRLPAYLHASKVDTLHPWEADTARIFRKRKTVHRTMFLTPAEKGPSGHVPSVLRAKAAVRTKGCNILEDAAMDEDLLGTVMGFFTTVLDQWSTQLTSYMKMQRDMRTQVREIGTTEELLCNELYLTSIDRLLKDHGNVVIAGPEGCGKSTLLDEWCSFHRVSSPRDAIIQYHITPLLGGDRVEVVAGELALYVCDVMKLDIDMHVLGSEVFELLATVIEMAWSRADGSLVLALDDVHLLDSPRTLLSMLQTVSQDVRIQFVVSTSGGVLSELEHTVGWPVLTLEPRGEKWAKRTASVELERASLYFDGFEETKHSPSLLGLAPADGVETLVPLELRLFAEETAWYHIFHRGPSSVHGGWPHAPEPNSSLEHAYAMMLDNIRAMTQPLSEAVGINIFVTLMRVLVVSPRGISDIHLIWILIYMHLEETSQFPKCSKARLAAAETVHRTCTIMTPLLTAFWGIMARLSPVHVMTLTGRRVIRHASLRTCIQRLYLMGPSDVQETTKRVCCVLQDLSTIAFPWRPTIRSEPRVSAWPLLEIGSLLLGSNALGDAQKLLQSVQLFRKVYTRLWSPQRSVFLMLCNAVLSANDGRDRMAFIRTFSEGIHPQRARQLQRGSSTAFRTAAPAVVSEAVQEAEMVAAVGDLSVELDMPQCATAPYELSIEILDWMTDIYTEDQDQRSDEFRDRVERTRMRLGLTYMARSDYSTAVDTLVTVIRHESARAVQRRGKESMSVAIRPRVTSFHSSSGTSDISSRMREILLRIADCRAAVGDCLVCCVLQADSEVLEAEDPDYSRWGMHIPLARVHLRSRARALRVVENLLVRAMATYLLLLRSGRHPKVANVYDVLRRLVQDRISSKLTRLLKRKHAVGPTTSQSPCGTQSNGRALRWTRNDVVNNEMDIKTTTAAKDSKIPSNILTDVSADDCGELGALRARNEADKGGVGSHFDFEIEGRTGGILADDDDGDDVFEKERDAFEEDFFGFPNANLYAFRRPGYGVVDEDASSTTTAPTTTTTPIRELTGSQRTLGSAILERVEEIDETNTPFDVERKEACSPPESPPSVSKKSFDPEESLTLRCHVSSVKRSHVVQRGTVGVLRQRSSPSQGDTSPSGTFHSLPTSDVDQDSSAPESPQDGAAAGGDADEDSSMKSRRRSRSVDLCNASEHVAENVKPFHSQPRLLSRRVTAESLSPDRQRQRSPRAFATDASFRGSKHNSHLSVSSYTTTDSMHTCATATTTSTNERRTARGFSVFSTTTLDSSSGGSKVEEAGNVRGKQEVSPVDTRRAWLSMKQASKSKAPFQNELLGSGELSVHGGSTSTVRRRSERLSLTPSLVGAAYDEEVKRPLVPRGSLLSIDIGSTFASLTGEENPTSPTLRPGGRRSLIGLGSRHSQAIPSQAHLPSGPLQSLPESSVRVSGVPHGLLPEASPRASRKSPIGVGVASRGGTQRDSLQGEAFRGPGPLLGNDVGVFRSGWFSRQYSGGSMSHMFQSSSSLLPKDRSGGVCWRRGHHPAPSISVRQLQRFNSVSDDAMLAQSFSAPGDPLADDLAPDAPGQRSFSMSMPGLDPSNRWSLLAHMSNTRTDDLSHGSVTDMTQVLGYLDIELNCSLLLLRRVGAIGSLEGMSLADVDVFEPEDEALFAAGLSTRLPSDSNSTRHNDDDVVSWTEGPLNGWRLAKMLLRRVCERKLRVFGSEGMVRVLETAAQVFHTGSILFRAVYMYRWMYRLHVEAALWIVHNFFDEDDILPDPYRKMFSSWRILLDTSLPDEHVAAMAGWETVKKIDLSRVNVTVSVLSILTEFLYQSRVQELILMEDLDEEGAKVVAPAICANPTLQAVVIRGRISVTSFRDPSVMEMDLSGRDFRAAEAVLIANLLRRNANLVTLWLQNNNIGDAGAVELACALEDNFMLRALDLRQNGITTQGARALANALEWNSALLVLAIDGEVPVRGWESNARLPDSSFDQRAHRDDVSLVAAQRATASVSEIVGPARTGALPLSGGGIRLDLSWRGLSDADCLVLARCSFTSVVLTEISLACNNLTSVGAQHIAQALADNETLVKLELQDNHIGDDGACALASALETNHVLTHLDISWNKFGDAAASKLSAALLKNTSLHHLNLYGNAVTDRGVRSFAEPLTENATLLTLNVGSYGLDLGSSSGTQPAEELASALRQNRCLASLCIRDAVIPVRRLRQGTCAASALCGQRFGEADAFLLAALIRFNPHTTVLDLSNNMLGSVGAAAIAEAIADAHELTQLTLCNNGIGDDGAAALANALPTSSITLLNLEGNPISSSGQQFLRDAIEMCHESVTLHLTPTREI